MMAGVSERKVALVTGASGDIGMETVRCLQRDGWAICATSLAITEALSRTLGKSDLALEADITDAEQAVSVVSECVQKLGRIDGLVNCVGASGVARFHEQSDVDVF